MSLTLEIITPSGGVLKTVESLRAEDLSGSFGILARHLDLLTVLRPCILIYAAAAARRVTWRLTAAY